MVQPLCGEPMGLRRMFRPLHSTSMSCRLARGATSLGGRFLVVGRSLPPGAMCLASLRPAIACRRIGTPAYANALRRALCCGPHRRIASTVEGARKCASARVSGSRKHSVHPTLWRSRGGAPSELQVGASLGPPWTALLFELKEPCSTSSRWYVDVYCTEGAVQNLSH